MTGPRNDLPWNFPQDWAVPDFVEGEVPMLAQEEGARIIGTQKALVLCGARSAPYQPLLKAGVAVFRLGWLFENNREVILEALRRERGRAGRF